MPLNSLDYQPKTLNFRRLQATPLTKLEPEGRNTQDLRRLAPTAENGMVFVPITHDDLVFGCRNLKHWLPEAFWEVPNLCRVSRREARGVSRGCPCPSASSRRLCPRGAICKTFSSHMVGILSLSIYMYVFIYVYICIYIYIHVYIYIS